MKKIIILVIIIALGVFVYQQNENRESSMDTREMGEGYSGGEEVQDSSEMTPVVFTSDSYPVSATSSLIKWKGEMIGVKSHEGTFSFKEGSEISINENGSLSGDIIIDLNSITSDTGGALNDHLKSADFFDAERYPEALLSIQSYDPVSNTVAAELTMKEITQPITIPVAFTETQPQIIGTGELEIDRSLWNIRYGSASFFDDLGDSVIDDEVEIEFIIALEK